MSRLTEAAYQSTPTGFLSFDSDLYKSIQEAPREVVQSFVIPIRSGKAWNVPKGSIFRISLPEGSQVGDLNIWNAHNPRERLWASRTRQLEAAHVTVGNKLWSSLPYLRPMVTIIEDSLKAYGKDDEGARVHDLLGTRCDPYINTALTGEQFDYHCHSNLVRAVIPFGLREDDVHDVLNVFQCTGLNGKDQYFMKTCPANKGDFIEMFAEQDLLCALSTCPGGDLSLPMWDDGHAVDTTSVCHPIKIEVFSLTNLSSVLERWNEPVPGYSRYTQHHGLHANEWA